MFDKWLGRAPTMIAMFTAAAFVAAVIYEVAYFQSVGTMFRRFLSVQDYFNSTPLWIPLAVIVLLGMTGINALGLLVARHHTRWVMLFGLILLTVWSEVRTMRECSSAA